tara:strand:+ start:357 stop:623 length:267 start_codon:yes stop_codon:yes gene_type:complete
MHYTRRRHEDQNDINDSMHITLPYMGKLALCFNERRELCEAWENIEGEWYYQSQGALESIRGEMCYLGRYPYYGPRLKQEPKGYVQTR